MNDRSVRKINVPVRWKCAPKKTTAVQVRSLRTLENRLLRNSEQPRQLRTDTRLGNRRRVNRWPQLEP